MGRSNSRSAAPASWNVHAPYIPQREDHAPELRVVADGVVPVQVPPGAEQQEKGNPPGPRRPEEQGEALQEGHDLRQKFPSRRRLSLGDVDAGVAIPIRTRVVASARGWTHFERRIGGVGVCDTLQGAER